LFFRDEYSAVSDSFSLTGRCFWSLIPSC